LAIKAAGLWFIQNEILESQVVQSWSNLKFKTIVPESSAELSTSLRIGQDETIDSSEDEGRI
jgi:hypothetical protein